jgi:hypothetical protein
MIYTKNSKKPPEIEKIFKTVYYKTSPVGYGAGYIKYEVLLYNTSGIIGLIDISNKNNKLICICDNDFNISNLYKHIADYFINAYDDDVSVKVQKQRKKEFELVKKKYIEVFL